MNSEIKQRIGRIQKGVAPEGYKKTKVGIVPDEWDERTFESLFTFNGGISIPRGKLTCEGINYLHYGDVHMREKNYMDIAAEENTIPKIPFDISTSGCVVLEDGDILFVDASEDYDGIGKSVVVYNQEKRPAIAGLHTIVAKGKTNDLFRDYKRFFMQTKDVHKQFVFYATGVSVFGVTKSNIGKIIAILPPLPEQEKIAEILSTWDKAIELKEQLIAGKKQQKKWLMQNLLTGKKRLPGFSDKWQEVRLGDMFIFERGLSASRNELRMDGGICYLHYGDIHKLNKTYINVRDEYLILPKLMISVNELNSNYLLHDGDIVFADASEDYEGTCKYIVVKNKENIPFIAGLHTIIARLINDSISDDFKQHCFSAFNVKRQFAINANGISVYGISKSSIAKISLLLPPLSEQTAIAEILSTADREIELHEKHLEELKKQKKALMQLLLTGIVRVNTREVS